MDIHVWSSYQIQVCVCVCMRVCVKRQRRVSEGGENETKYLKFHGGRIGSPTMHAQDLACSLLHFEEVEKEKNTIAAAAEMINLFKVFFLCDAQARQRPQLCSCFFCCVCIAALFVGAAVQ